MTAILKREKTWRYWPILGLTMVLTGCVTAAVPPCSTPQRLARLRQEQVLRGSINKRRRALVASEVKSTALNCQKQHIDTTHPSASCLILQRRKHSLAARIHQEEIQLQVLLKTDDDRQSLFGKQASCLLPPAPTLKHAPVIHRNKRSHHDKQPPARTHSRHKAHPAVLHAVKQADQPITSAPVIAEAPKTTQALGKPTEVTAAKSSPPPVASQPEHDYVVDPHMRVIGRSFFQDDIKLPHESDAH